MTTPIVPSISDEDLDAIEQYTMWTDKTPNSATVITFHELQQVIARLRDNEKDAARYRFLCDPGDADEDCLAHAINTLNAWADKSEIDQAVDAAMEQSK